MKFCTAINCMDGRVQRPVIEFLEKTFEADCVDAVTEPGPNRILSEQANETLVQSILNRVDISVNHHGARQIAVVGHYDCAGNPADRPEQLEHLANSVAFIKNRYPNTDVIAVWVDERWQAEQVALISRAPFC